MRRTVKLLVCVINNSTARCCCSVVKESGSLGLGAFPELPANAYGSSAPGAVVVTISVSALSTYDEYPLTQMACGEW